MSELGQKLIAETRRIAAERPDFVYTGPCQYIEEGNPGCLIGHALCGLGIIDETFEYHPINMNGIVPAAALLNLDIDENELLWLETAQNVQDTNVRTWGSAIERADFCHVVSQ